MARLRHLLAGALSAATLACGLAGPAASQEVTPMRVELVPAAGSRSALLLVRNRRETDSPFEVVALRRLTAPDGTETLETAEEDFIIFPPQGLVKSGASQSVRIEYVGDQNITESRSYIIDVREVPVTPPGFSGILTVYNFGVAVYVKPPGAFDDLHIASISREGDLIAFEIQNRGNDFAILSRRDLELRFGAELVRMTGADFAGRTDNPVVPPNSVRQFQMRADGLPAGSPGEIRIRSLD